VSKFNAAVAESGFQNLYDYPSNFQARAWILKQPREELYKYLDVPAFERGDLFYIQNLVAIIEAPSDGSPTSTPAPTSTQPSPTPVNCTPLGDINCSGKVDIMDLSALLTAFGSSNITSDLNNNGKVDIGDLSILLSNFGRTI
jgi:hypothetical protein